MRLAVKEPPRPIAQTAQQTPPLVADLARPCSDAKAREVAFRVAQPGSGARREHTGEHLCCIGGKGKRRGRGVLFEAADMARPGNWYDKRLLAQQPGKR